MFKIAVCDDQKIYHSLINQYILKWAKEIDDKVEITNFYSAEEFIFYWKEEVEYDLVILDIELKGMSGLDLAFHIRKIDKDINIIFFTGYSEFVFEGYDVNAINYLLKPINEEKLIKSLNIANEFRKASSSSDEVIVFKSGKDLLKIKLNDIKYFIMFSHYLDVVTINGTFKWKKKISDLEKEFKDKDFIRCHRSYIVNKKYITKVNKDSIILFENISIPISISRMKEVKKALLEF